MPAQPVTNTDMKKAFSTRGLSPEQLKGILLNFMTKLGFDFEEQQQSPILRDMELETGVRNKLKQLGLCSTDFQLIKNIHSHLTHYAQCCLGWVSLEVRIFAGAYTVLTTAIDDALLGSEVIRTFALNYGKGQPQGHPLLDCLVRLLNEETPKHFGRYATINIITSTLDGINSISLESVFPSGFPSSVPGFPVWIRSRSGYTTSYVYLAFPEENFPEDRDLGLILPILPNFGLILCYINDVLSFYKERILRAENCLISNIGIERHISDREALEWTIEQSLNAHYEILQLVAAKDQRIATVYRSYLTGYLQWHLMGRYKLEQIGLSI